jgi:hypothetical protein
MGAQKYCFIQNRSSIRRVVCKKKVQACRSSVTWENILKLKIHISTKNILNYFKKMFWSCNKNFVAQTAGEFRSSYGST